MDNIDLMNYWIKSADRDYSTMEVLFAGEKYTWSLFVGHLVIEKLLKAIYAKQNKTTPYAPKSHDLYFLASKIPLKITEEQEDLLNTITRFNIDGRYDDYKNAFYNLCDRDYTTSSIKKINNVRDWLFKIINTENNKESEGKENE